MFTFHQSFLIFVVVAICNEARNFAMPNMGNSWEKLFHSYRKNSCASLSLTKLKKSAAFFPWMAKVFMLGTDGKNYTCTATIVSRNYLLTAAHCVDDTIKKWHVLMGSKNVENAQRHEVKEGIKHPAYEFPFPAPPINDIGLLKLAHPLKFDYVRTAPICLGGKTTTEGTVAGWGQNRHAKQCPNGGTRKPLDNIKIMGSGQVKIVPMGSEECPPFNYNSNDEKLICAVALNAVVDDGDSGGPLMVQRAGGGWQQIGVTAVMRGCHTPTPVPMGFTAVNHYCDWITENTRGEVKCVD